MMSSNFEPTLPLERALEQSGKRSGGVFTLVLGGSNAGKNALGLAFARTVLHKKGWVTILQPHDGGGPLRTPQEVARRLAASVERMPQMDETWRERVLFMQPSQAVGSGGRFSPRLANGGFWPQEAAEIDAQQRMLLVQDYNALARAESSVTPGLLRSLAVNHRMSVYALADTTGGSHEVAHLPSDGVGRRVAHLWTAMRDLLLKGMVSDEGLEFAQQQMPEIVDAARAKAAGQPAAALPFPTGVRPVKVHEHHLALIEAAHRVVLVERVGARILMHTLKSPAGAALEIEFELDPGYLAWPPQHFEQPKPGERNKPPKVAQRPGEVQHDPELHAESPRG